MLININPVLSPELLFHLRSMGHGEKLILADANFPANTSNDKVFFGVQAEASIYIQGNTSESFTYAVFIKLADI